MYDPMTLCSLEPRAGYDFKWFAVEPAVMYPATIERVLDCLDGEAPTELGDAAGSIMGMASQVPPAAWDLALSPAPEDKGLREVRAAALEVARLWFTQAMQVIHGTLGIHITKNEDYRL